MICSLTSSTLPASPLTRAMILQLLLPASLQTKATALHLRLPASPPSTPTALHLQLPASLPTKCMVLCLCLLANSLTTPTALYLQVLSRTSTGHMVLQACQRRQCGKSSCTCHRWHRQLPRSSHICHNLSPPPFLHQIKLCHHLSLNTPPLPG